MDTEQKSSLDAAIAAEPSAEAWGTLCALLAPLRGEALEEALAAARAPVLGWPAAVRHARLVSWTKGPQDPWLRGLFEGRFDPRLELVGRARIEHSRPFSDVAELVGRYFVRGMYPIALAFGRFVDPGFDPPDVVIHEEHEYTSAAGCGGGFDSERRGDDTRGLSWYDRITEHAADDSSDGAWTPWGLRWDGTFSLGRYERGSGAYQFSAEGPAPEVFALAMAWGLLLTHGGVVTADIARDALELSREQCRCKG